MRISRQRQITASAMQRVHSTLPLWFLLLSGLFASPQVLWPVLGSALIGCVKSNLIEKETKKKQDSEKENDETSKPIKVRKKTEANFGGVPPPSNPTLETQVAISVEVAEDHSAEGYSLGPSDVIVASYSIVGCKSGFAPSGSFTNSGTSKLYRSDSGCAVAVSSFTFNGTSYTRRDGTFLTAQGSSNAFVSTSSAIVIAINVKTQLNATLGAAGEKAEFTAHLVSPGPNQSLTDFLIITPVASNSTVAENSGTATFNLQVQGTSTVPTTVYYTLSGTAVQTYDFNAVSGTISIPPGATTVPLNITLINDSTPELDETIILTLDKTRSTYFPVESSPTITITDDDIVYPTTGLAARYEPSGHVVISGAISTWNDSTTNALHATQGTTASRPTLIVSALNGFNATSFDGIDDFLSPPANSALLSAATFTAKTYSLALRTGPDVTNRQVIYRQGDTTRGMLIYIQSGFLYFTGYNGSNDDSGATTPWGVRHVKTEVSPDTVYIVRCVYDQANNQMQLYLDTLLADTASNVGSLFPSTGSGSNLGGIASTASMRFHDGSTTTGGSYFKGLIYEFAHYNNNTAGTAGLSLDIFLFKRYGLDLPQEVSVTSSATGVNENGGTATLTLSRSIVTASALVVPLTITGSATAGSDFQTLPSSVTIPAYQASTTLTFTAVNDTASDSGESVSIAVASSAGYIFGPSKMVTIEIADDESYNPPSSQFIYYRGSNVTRDGGGQVTNWANNIPGGLYNAIPTSKCLKPTYVASSLLNSKPALSFDGTEGLDIAINTAINSGGPYNFRGIAMVIRTGTSVTTDQTIYKQGNSTSGMNIYISASSLHFEAWNTSGQVFSKRISRAVTTNSNYFVIFQFNGTTGQITGRLNGVDYTSANTIGSLPSEIGGSTGNSLGYNDGRTNFNGVSQSATVNFKGLLAEFLYFNAALSWAQIREMELYFLPFYAL